MQPQNVSIRKKLNHNDATLEAYNKNICRYIQTTPNQFGDEHWALVFWIRLALFYIPKNGTVLEIGSGAGRDAKFIEELGYKVTRSDGAKGFVAHLKEAGYDTLLLNVLTDPLPHNHQMIFANAVLPHFDSSETDLFLKKVFKALPPGGIAAINAKQGLGSTWITEKMNDKRFVKYWHPKELHDLMADTGFEIKYFAQGLHGDLSTHTWTHFILKRPD